VLAVQNQARAATAAAQHPTLLGLEVVGARQSGHGQALQPLPGKVNYYLGDDPKSWRTGIPTFGRVSYRGVYPGIDLTFYGNQRNLEYDFNVAPGANPAAIVLRFPGASKATVDAGGNLVVKTANAALVQHKPTVYQLVNGARRAVSGGYVLTGPGRVGFALGHYDGTRPLVIDPVLSYSTLLGGDGEDGSWSVAVDPAGNIYHTGISNSLSASVPYPLKNAFMAACCGGNDSGRAVVTKLDPTGSSLVYSTYIGGTYGYNGVAQPCPTPTTGCGGAAYFARGWDQGHGIAADAAGNAYVGGQAESLNFPTTADAMRRSHPGPSFINGGADPYRDHPRDGFLAKFDPTGKLVYSTLIGGHGSDFVNAISVVDSGPYPGIYVGGTAQSVDFFTCTTPTGCSNGGMPAVNSYQTELNLAPGTNRPGGPAMTGFVSNRAVPASCHDAATGANNWACWRDAFAMRFSLDGKTVLWSTLYGGTGDDGGNGIAVDPVRGNVYLSGEAEASDFPITAGALGQCHNGNGGYPSEPALQSAGMAPFPCHLSPSPQTADYPTQSRKTNNDAFVAKFSPSGAVLYSTYLGGTQDEASGAPAGNFTGGQGNAISVDSAGIAYVTGFTESSSTGRGNVCGPDLSSPCPAQVPFQTTATAYQSDLKQPLTPGVRPAHANAFLTKLNPEGTAILYSTYLGGSGDDEAYAIANDGKGVAYVVGYTDSPDFPSKLPLAGQQFINGAATPPAPTAPPQYTDAFVFKLDTTLSGAASLAYSTYLGASADEEARAVVYVDKPPFKGVYVSGFTASDGLAHPGAPGYPGSPTCDPATGAPPGSSPCPGTAVAFKTTPGAFQTKHTPGRTRVFTAEPDASTPLPADPSEEAFIVKIAD
jgi:hypothetical protein